MPTEYRILKELPDGKVEVAEIWATGWQVVTYKNKEAIPQSK